MTGYPHPVDAVVKVTGFDKVISRHCERCGQPVVLAENGWSHLEPRDVDDDAD